MRFLISLILAIVLLAGCESRKASPTLPGAHPGDWMDIASPDFHGSVALSTGVEGCRTCHGLDFSGGKSGIACTECHGSGQENCVVCHGGTDNNTGAPPVGLQGETDDTTLAVGAHTVHLAGTTLTDGIPCSRCHTVPLFAWDESHFDFDIAQGPGIIDSIAEVHLSDFSDSLHGSWFRNTRTCADTYCHGSFTGGFAANVPNWTAENQAFCGSCHDIGNNSEALGWKHAFHIDVAGFDCAACHGNVVNDQLDIISRSLHVNGIGDTLTADTAVCNTCHGAGTSACTFCHGGIDNETGAPPDGLHGETLTTSLAVGAHTAHIIGKSMSDGIPCSECHVVPASVLDAGHLGADSIAEMSWGTLAGGSASWNRATGECSNTYCHGTFSGGYSANRPVWTANNQAACGSCHDAGTAPQFLGGLHRKHLEEEIDCFQCHSLTVNASRNIIGLAVHIDGESTVSFASGSGTFSNNRCSNIVCHESKPWSGGKMYGWR